MKPNYIDIWICNFNTTQFTNKAIKSIIKNVKSFKYNINIFDNSTIDKFKLDKDIDQTIVKIYDNTDNKYINFDNIYKSKKLQGHFSGSANHSITIQYIIDNLSKDNMLLMDSDIYLKKDIDFIDDNFSIISGIHYNECDFEDWNRGHKLFKYKLPTRFVPFIQYLNLKLLRDNNIKYCDNITEIVGCGGGYDTGGTIYRDIIAKKLSYKEIKENEYIFHYGGSSYYDANVNKIPFNLFFIWLGDKKPNYVDFCVNSFIDINPLYNTYLYHYTLDDISKISSIPENNFKTPIKYDIDYLLHFAYYYTKKENNITECILDKTFLSKLHNTFIYVLINNIGGIYLDCDTFPIKPFDKSILYYNDFVSSVIHNDNACIQTMCCLGSQVQKINTDKTFLYPLNIENEIDKKKFLNCELELTIDNYSKQYFRHFNVNYWDNKYE